MRLAAIRLVGALAIVVALTPVAASARPIYTTGAAVPTPAAGSGAAVLPNPHPQTQQGDPVGPPALKAPHASQQQALHRAEADKRAASSYRPPAGPSISTAAYDVYSGTSRPVVGNAPTAKAPSDGFDYGDAAIAASVVTAFALLVAGGVMTVRRRGQLQHG